MSAGVTGKVVLGVDIGGSGIKAAPVDLATGVRTAERARIPTPSPPNPEQIAAVVAELAGQFEPTATVGVGYPGVVRAGVAHTAANLDQGWLGVNIAELVTTTLGRPAVAINDADAAGLAEMRFGAGAGVGGVVVMVTLGTGIGSGLFVDGVLVPNTEFGHIEVDGAIGESRAAAVVREREDLSWKAWAARVQTYLEKLEDVLWPDLIIIGGGVSKSFDKFGDQLSIRTPLVPATLGNSAGIVGAALATELAPRRTP